MVILLIGDCVEREIWYELKSALWRKGAKEVN